MICCVHRRCRALFEQAAREGIELPQFAHGHLMLSGARLGLDRKAIVLVVAGHSQVETIFAQALRATFPRRNPRRRASCGGSGWDFGI